MDRDKLKNNEAFSGQRYVTNHGKKQEISKTRKVGKALLTLVVACGLFVGLGIAGNMDVDVLDQATHQGKYAVPTEGIVNKDYNNAVERAYENADIVDDSNIKGSR